jgi:hypothetical protein
VKKSKHKKKSRLHKSYRVSNSECVTSSHCDPEGKIIFQYENLTPTWMINKLLHHFIDEKNEICKCWGLSV